MLARENSTAFPLNIVGSSTFGRYPKISIEKTYNMFVSDTALVPYAGYAIAINATAFDDGKEGRGVYASTKLGKMIVVIEENVYLVNITFMPNYHQNFTSQVVFIGKLQTDTGVVYIAENNKPQILISDNSALYIYDPTLTPTFQVVSTPDFIPGYITFHDTYFLCAARDDSFYTPPATNTWRLSQQNDGTMWLSDSASIGLLETKPDITQAVIRFPSRGNMILVMGSNVTETWYDTGAQLFPYQRNNQGNMDYGCLSPATVAYMDEIVVWLAKNEKSGAIIMYSDGGMPEKITTDGFDYFFHQLKAPQDSQGFLYRQDGHLIYHINFYTDNLSVFVDFNTKKIYHACDQNLNYFIAGQLAYFNDQYYFISKNTGNLYAFDTTFTTFQDTDSLGNVQFHEIPRMRTCKNIRKPSQEYYIINDVGFTIETGETNYQRQEIGVINLITEDGKYIETEGGFVDLITEDGNFLITQDGNNIVGEMPDTTTNLLISEQMGILQATPAVDLTMSYDGGATFGNAFRYNLNPIGQRQNRLMWWQCGAGNDCVTQFKFWGIGRFVAFDGVANIRQ